MASSENVQHMQRPLPTALSEVCFQNDLNELDDPPKKQQNIYI